MSNNTEEGDLPSITSKISGQQSSHEHGDLKANSLFSRNSSENQNPLLKEIEKKDSGQLPIRFNPEKPINNSEEKLLDPAKKNFENNTKRRVSMAVDTNLSKDSKESINPEFKLQSERRKSVVEDDMDEISNPESNTNSWLMSENTSDTELSKFNKMIDTSSTNATSVNSNHSILSDGSQNRISLRKKNERISTSSDLQTIQEDQEPKTNASTGNVTTLGHQTAKSSMKKQKHGKSRGHLGHDSDQETWDSADRQLKSEKAMSQVSRVSEYSQAMHDAIKYNFNYDEGTKCSTIYHCSHSSSSTSFSEGYITNNITTTTSNIARLLDSTIQKMSTLAMMNRVRSKTFKSEIEVTVTSSGVIQKELNKNSKINVKASTNYMNQRPSKMMQMSKTSTNGSFINSSSSSDERDGNTEHFRLSNLTQPGKSDVKKIKQIRKTNTFAFSFKDIAQESTDDDTDYELMNESSGVSISRQSKAASKKTDSSAGPSSKTKPLTFKLDKEAIFRASQNRAKDKRKKWLETKRSVTKGSVVKDKNKKKKLRFQDMKRRRETICSNDILGTDVWLRANLLDSITHDEELNYRSENKRKIITFQIDEYAGYPFREFLYTENEEFLLQQLAVWLDIERLRRTTQYGADISEKATYKAYYVALVKKYIVDPEALDGIINPFLRNEILKLDAEEIIDIPKPFLRIQRDILENLVNAYDDYIMFQRDEFTEECLKYNKNRNGSRKSVGFADLSDCHLEDYDTTEMPNTDLQMRMLRAAKFLIDMTVMHLDYNDECPQNKCIPEFSDDNGDIREIEKPVRYVNAHYWRTKPLTPQEVFAISKVEYPKKGQKQVRYNLRMEVNYMRPLRKGNVVINRPTTRPKSMKDILKNQTYFEYFKKFLKYHNVDRMIVFWKAVEIMKNTSNDKSSQF